MDNTLTNTRKIIYNPLMRAYFSMVFIYNNSNKKINKSVERMC